MTSGLERFLRWAVVPTIFVLTLLGWCEDQATSATGFSWPMVLYLTLQSFFLNAPAEPNMPPLLVLMQFLAPLSLATVALTVFGRMFNLGVRRWAANLYWRNERRILLMGLGWRSEVHVPPFPQGTHAFILTDLPRAPDRTVLPYPTLTPQLLKAVGVRKAARVFAYPADNQEAWQLLGLLSRSVRTTEKPVPVTILTDNFSDVEILLDLKQKELRSLLGLSESLDLRFERLEDLTAQYLVDTYAPHRHPSRQASLRTEGPQVVIQGSGTLTNALTREVLSHLHYPGAPGLRLTLVGGDYPLPQGLDLVAQVTQVPFGFIPRYPDTPHTVFVIAETVADLYEQVRSWHQNTWANRENAPQIVPILSGRCDPTLQRSADLQFRHLGMDEGGIDLKNTESGLDWSRLVEGHESFERVARSLHGLWMATPGITGMEEWENLSQSEREMNLRSARHLTIKLWSLGLDLDIVEEGTFDPQTKIIGQNLSEAIAHDRDRDEVLMRAEHQRWMAEKIVEGFVPLPGEMRPLPKNELKYLKNQLRVHGDLCDFSQLTPDAQGKDRASFQLGHLFATCPGLKLTPRPNSP